MMAVPTSFSRSVKIYSSLIANMPHLESADKIILPERMLAELQHVLSAKVRQLAQIRITPMCNIII